MMSYQIFNTALRSILLLRIPKAMNWKTANFPVFRKTAIIRRL